MASSRPKLFVFDIDGTLLTSTYSVLSTTQHALEKVQSVGHFVVLASARPPKSAQALTQSIGQGGKPIKYRCLWRR